MKKQIVIVGGGSAGWITALYLNRYIDNSQITLIESPEIGILGAGEGTTPNFVTFLDEVQIPISDLIKHAGATIKNGIKFTNWNNDEKHFYHTFLTDHPALSNISASDLIGEYNLTSVLSIAEEVVFEEYDFMSKICELNKVPQVYDFKKENNIPTGYSNPIIKYNRLANFALHFDATRLASFLKKVALERGVINIEATVTAINEDKEGNVTSFKLQDDTLINADFVFDCSGFSRLIVGKHFNAEWVSYSNYLPVDTAVPFFIDNDEEIPPYTESIAMKYGWMWKIPLQNRYGCGYVFDSSLTSEEEAIKEIENYLGFKPIYPRETKGAFKFKAGYYKTPWVKNCVAIGLSSGFIEPLEATSIYSSLSILKKFVNDLSHIESPSQPLIDRFNTEAEELTNGIFNFVYFHYLGKRNDSKFWNKFKAPESHPLEIQKKLNIINNFVPKNIDFTGITPFGLHSWLSVAYGLNQLNIDVMKEMVKNNCYREKFKKEIEVWKSNIEVASSDCTSHVYFLKVLKQ
jgi:tryptophan halogenase